MDISACDQDGRNAVHYAALHHDIDNLKTILNIPNHGIDLNQQDSSGRTPLFWSAGYNTENSSDTTQDRIGNEYFECMKLLLSQPGIDPNIKDSNGENVFLRCVMNGRFNSVKHLLENAEKYKINILDGDNDGDNALYFAAWFGYANVLKLLLDTNKFDVNSCGKNNSGYSPLSIICKSQQMHHFDCFKLLLSRKDIDVNKYTPLLYCLSRKKTQYFKYMINNNNKPGGGYKIDWEKNIHPSAGNLLHCAVSYGNLKIVQFLMKAAEKSGYKFDINKIGGANKETVLNTCVLKLTEARRASGGEGDYNAVSKADKEDNFELFKYLLSQPGINPNIKDLSKDNSWLHANYFGLIDYVKYFVENSRNGKKEKEIKKGAKKEEKDKEKKEEKEENGGWIVDFNSENSDRTCIEYAAFQGHYEIIKYLLECDKFLNLFKNIEEHVKRALHLCCMAKHQSIKTQRYGANHLKIFESLLYFLANNKFKIDVSKTPYIDKGTTMIQSCVLMNRYDFVKFLIENDSRATATPKTPKTATTTTTGSSKKEDSKFQNLSPTKLGYTINWNVRDHKNFDILFYAVKNSNFQMLRLLFNTKSFVDSISNINQTYPLKAKKLMVAVTTASETATSAASAAAGPGANGKGSSGNNFSSNRGSILHQCVKSLTNWSPSSNTCENLKCFKLLCDLKGINVNIQNSGGYTPLMLAIQMGKTSFVEHLVNKHEKGKLNVNFSLRTKQLDYDCLSIAALKANYLVMRCLLNANNKRCQINVNNVSKTDGNTALHLCVLLKGRAPGNFDFDKHRCFKLLLSQPGIDTNIKNKDGKDVLTICKENNLDEFTDLLPSKEKE